MTKLYLMDLRRYDHGQWQKLLPLLPSQRQQRISACRLEADKQRLAGAGYLLKTALEKEGVLPEEQIFAENPWGKPFLKNREHICFSLSHSGHHAVCAVSDAAVGVDVETLRCTMEVARRFFHPDELAQTELLDEAARTDVFTRLWTAKEAFVKMLGRGLTVPLDSFSVTLGTPSVLQQSYTDYPCHLHEYRQEAYRVCLCCADLYPETVVL